MPNKVKFPTLSSFFVAFCIYIIIVLALFIKLTFFSEPPKKYTDDKDAIMDVVMVDREVDQTIKAPKQAKEVVKETKPEPKKESEEDKQETTNKPVVPDEPLNQSLKSQNLVKSLKRMSSQRQNLSLNLRQSQLKSQNQKSQI